MFVLVGLFVLNGFQSVGESESGVETRFGRIVATDLEPGFQRVVGFDQNQPSLASIASISLRSQIIIRHNGCT